MTLNPRTRETEFGGPAGVVVLCVGLIILCELAFYTCNEQGCPVSWVSLQPYKELFQQTPLVSKSSMYVYLAWFFGLVALDQVLPGTKMKGTKLRDGTHLEYKFNGRTVMLVLAVALGYRAYSMSLALPELVYLYEHILELTNASLIVSFVLSVALYAATFIPRASTPIFALGGNTGNAIYDWFIGRELNPRIGSLDLKTFCEMRPGLLLWILINLSMAHHQYLKYGYVTDSMVLVNIFQAYYVVEGTLFEEGLLSMMDITSDGFGFMLCFGDLTLVPFTYTLQTRFLADHPVCLGVYGSAGLVGVFLVGLYVYRMSNNEKIAFRNHEEWTKSLQYIESEDGHKLLVSGWWGTARHVNYFGDWIISWAYCLATGFRSVIPYYYIVFFAGLLIHREARDEAKCSAKYKKTWIEYKRRVPYRMIPGVF